MLRDFSQQEIVPTTSFLEDLMNHVAGELSSDHNLITSIFYSEQPSPINVMLEPPIEVSSVRSSSTSSSSDSGASGLKPLNIMSLQAIPMESTPFVTLPNQTCSD